MKSIHRTWKFRCKLTHWTRKKRSKWKNQNRSVISKHIRSECGKTELVVIRVLCASELIRSGRTGHWRGRELDRVREPSNFTIAGRRTRVCNTIDDDNNNNNNNILRVSAATAMTCITDPVIRLQNETAGDVNSDRVNRIRTRNVSPKEIISRRVCARTAARQQHGFHPRGRCTYYITRLHSNRIVSLERTSAVVSRQHYDGGGRGVIYCIWTRTEYTGVS